MKQEFYVVDAFTDTPFKGNPAAVCILEKAYDDKLMSDIAREMNLSETAFILPIDLANAEFSLRWLTPAVEVNLCGHATIASSWVLIKEAKIIPENIKEINFQTRSGKLTVSLVENQENYLQMNFPLGNPSKVEFSDELKLEFLLSFGVSAALSDIIDVQFCPNTRKLLIHTIPSLIDSLQPASSQLISTAMKVKDVGIDIRGVIVTAKGEGKYAKFDFVSRYFAPWVGIEEDPVTGSAHTVLAKYWAQILDTQRELVGWQASPNRGGEVKVEIISSLENGEKRVFIRGTAVTVSKGELYLPS